MRSIVAFVSATIAQSIAISCSMRARRCPRMAISRCAPPSLRPEIENRLDAPRARFSQRRLRARGRPPSPARAAHSPPAGPLEERLGQRVDRVDEPRPARRRLGPVGTSGILPRCCRVLGDADGHPPQLILLDTLPLLRAALLCLPLLCLRARLLEQERLLRLRKLVAPGVLVDVDRVITLERPRVQLRDPRGTRRARQTPRPGAR